MVELTSKSKALTNNEISVQKKHNKNLIVNGSGEGVIVEKEVIRKRLKFISIILISLMAVLIVRVGYWNIFKGEFLQAQAEKQWIADSKVSAKRGSILDKNMNVLAQSAASDTLVFLPQDIKDPEAVANAISPIIDIPKTELLYKAATKTRVNDQGETKNIGEVWIKRQLTSEQVSQIEQLDLDGVKLVDDIKRYYPNKEMSSQIIGYTNADGVGQTGIERRYNSILEGRHGRLVAETDKLRNDIPNGQEMLIEPVNGENVVLTLDEVMQNFLDTACNEGMQNLSPDSVQGLIMDVTTGEMLAMTNIPSFDLNSPPRSDGELLQNLSANRITASEYKPGNIFTVFTAAATLEAGQTESQYECNGIKEWYGEEIICTKSHGIQTFEQAVSNECLIAASQMADKLGKQNFYNALSSFGFGEKSGIDFSTDATGDVMGIKYASELDVAKMGAGDNLKLSQIQLATAAASLINGGNLFVPRLVKGLANDQNELIENYDVRLKGQSISVDTSDKMQQIFKSNVYQGEAQDALLNDYTTGALYGITDKYNSDGSLEIGKKISMFIEYAPASNPKYLVLVTFNGIEESKAQYAGAPYAKAILREILKYAYIQPDGGFDEIKSVSDDNAPETESQNLITVPNVVEMNLATATTELENIGLQAKADGAGTVVEQVPEAGSKVSENTVIELKMDYKYAEKSVESNESNTQIELIAVPDFSGLTMREAMDLAIDSGLKFIAQGDGVAKKQYPVSGTQVKNGSSVVVTFKLDMID